MFTSPTASLNAGLAALPPIVESSSSSDAWSAYRISQRSERLRLLQKLLDERTPVHLQRSQNAHEQAHDGSDHNAPAAHTLAARLWSLDSSHDRLSWSVQAQHPGLDDMLQAQTWDAVALQDQVKLQFTLHNPLLVRSESGCVLQASLPEAIYRFQRRESFRVSSIERMAPTACFRHPAIPDMQLALRLLDVSLGGCALWQPHDVPALQAGTQMAEVSIELDSQTRFKTHLTVQNVCPASANSPAVRGARLGCAWQPLAGPAERTLQRWIDQAQKRQRLLAQGADTA